MHTTTDIDPISELQTTEGWLDGRHVWFVSDGRVIPFISGGDGSDDGLSDEDRAALEDLSDDEVAALDSLSDDDLDKLEGLSDEELDKLTGGKGTDWEAEAKKWKRLARKHENRNKSKRRKGGAPPAPKGGSGSGGDDNDVDVEAIRQEVLGEARKDFAERSVEVFLDAQVEAGRLSDDQADVLLDSIDPTKFIDDDGDVDTDKVKALIEGIAKPARGSGNGKKNDFPDTGQGRRNGSRRRKEKSSSVSAGRELFTERHGKKSTQNN